MSEKDPFFNPNVAKDWPAPQGEPISIDKPAISLEVVDSSSDYLRRLKDMQQESARSDQTKIINETFSAATPDARPRIIFMGNAAEEAPVFPYDSALSTKAISELITIGMYDKIQAAENGQEIEYKPLAAKSPIIFTKIRDTHFETRAEAREDLLAMEGELKQAVSENKIAAIAEKFIDRYSSEANGDISEESFKIGDDTVANVAMLSAIGMLRGYDIDFITVDPAETKEYLNEKFNELIKSGDSLNLVPDEGRPGVFSAVKHQIHNSPVSLFLVSEEPFTLDTDLTDVSFRIGWSIDRGRETKETANQAEHIETDNFLERPFGVEFIDALDQSGLKLSTDFEQFISSRKKEWGTDFDDRFGAEYTQLSRVLAKVIHDGDLSRMKAVFMDSEDLEMDIEDKLRQFASVNTGNEPLRIVQDILTQILGEAETPVGIPKIEDTKAQVDIKHGACFDVTDYYLGALELGQLNTVEIEGASFLEKKHGAHTFMNMEPVVYKGIKIPQGGLFARGGDGGFAFLRLTPFVFDNESDVIDAFGSEAAKGEANSDMTVSDAKHLMSKRTAASK